MNTLGTSEVKIKASGKTRQIECRAEELIAARVWKLGDEWRGFVTKRHRLATLPIFHSRTWHSGTRVPLKR